MVISRIARKFFLRAVSGSHIGKDTDVDIAVSCPICGDSRTNKRSARLHLYCKDNYEGISCFNGDCAAHNKSVYGFLKDFYPTLLDAYKRETFKGTLKSLGSGDVFSEVEKVATKCDVVTQDLSVYMQNILESSDALQYLESRGLPYNSKHGNWYFGSQDLKIGDILYKITNSIVIPLYYKSEMYGFYSRSIVGKTFVTYMNDVNVGFKVWNWFSVDKNKPVYIFEGIFDAIASGLDNVVALMGAKMPRERLSELKLPVFVLDNDTTGLRNSLGYASNGFSIYIQPDKYPEKDMNEFMLKNGNAPETILANVYNGISAEIRIKSKL